MSALALTGVPAAAGWSAAIGVALALSTLVAGLALWRVRGRAGSARLGSAAAIVLALLAAALPAVGVAQRADVRAPPGLAALGGRLDILMTATEAAAPGDDRVRGVASSLGGDDGVVLRGEVPVLVLDAVVIDPIAIGARLAVRGGVRALPAGESIAALVYADGTAVERIAAPPWWLAWGDSLRTGFRAIASTLPGDGGALLTGLAIGDDAGVPQGLVADMRTASLTHLTAVSGANCAIIVAAVMLIGVATGVRRRWRIGGALLALVLFVVLVTPQPSVVRAAVMAAFALGGLAAARPMRGLPLLSVAIAGILVVDPWASREYGFVLSVLATSGLLVLSGPLGRALAAVMPMRLAAQIACQPVIALLDPSLPTYGVVANLLAVPAAPLATVAGLLACLIAPFAPPVAVAFAWVGWLPSAWIAGVATTTASLPAARLPWSGGVLGFGLLAVAASALGVATLARGRTRLIAGLVLAAFGVVYLGSLAGAGAMASLGRPQDWQIAMCPVGQGDASVVRGGGAVALVDTGPEPEALAGCLSGLGIGRIDLLVLSHFDRDHVGGTEAVLGRVDRVIHGPADADGARTILEPLAAGGAAHEQVARGAAGVLGGLTWQVLWPRADRTTEPGNDASLVLRFSAVPASPACAAVRCATSVFLGDLGEESQSRLLSAGRLAQADVVKVSHHGSADQAAALYGAIRAPLAIIGVGENEYGHPTQRTLAMLRALGTTIGRTDIEGLLLMGTSADALTLWRERAPTSAPTRGTGSASPAASAAASSAAAARASPRTSGRAPPARRIARASCAARCSRGSRSRAP
jgi:competence protein ComEC